MNRAPAVVFETGDGPHGYKPTTFKNLGRSEHDLETVLADHPELLGLELRDQGVRGPYAVFRQLELPRPDGRVIYPDIVILSGSGHFVIVEVKLSVNPELRDRNVIAQITDYAASVAELDDDQLLVMFAKDRPEAPSWGELVEGLFPGAAHVDELATVLRRRAHAGEVNLVIACDQVPFGTTEILRSVASLDHTAYRLDLVEVTPFVSEESPGVLYVPSVRQRTEIVSRTAVTVNLEYAPDEQDRVRVQTTSLGEIEREQEEAESDKRVWTAEEVEELVRDAGDPIEIELLDFAKLHSDRGQIAEKQKRSSAGFNYYVAGVKDNGKPARYLFYGVNHSWGTFYVAVGHVRRLVDPPVVSELQRRLSEVLGKPIGDDVFFASGETAELGDRAGQLNQIALWFQEQASARQAGAS